MPDTVGRQNNPAPSQHAIEALHLATAYQASRALQVAIRLGLVDLIVGEPQSAQARTIGISPSDRHAGISTRPSSYVGR